MTEKDWLKAKDPELMLETVAEWLSQRKWYLLACTEYRRLIMAMNQPEPIQFLDQVEEQKDARRSLEQVTPGVVSIQDLHRAVVGYQQQSLVASHSPSSTLLERQIRDLVHSCDPDADPRQYQDVAGRKTNPAVPFFRAASQYAALAIRTVHNIEEISQSALRMLLNVTDQASFTTIREILWDGFRVIAETNIYATSAVDLKTRGDELADRGTTRNVRQTQGNAERSVDWIEEKTRNRIDEVTAQVNRSARKALGRSLHEQLGNPFRQYRFDPRWRTSEVMQLARAIYEIRAYDRYPILADALLDADCDEEPILRHLRGTEEHLINPVHCRGCWVIDLILELDSEVFSHDPLHPAKTPRGRHEPLGLAEPPIY